MNKAFLPSIPLPLKMQWRNKLAACLLIFSLTAPLPAVAQTRTYVPPRTGSPPDARTIAGTRGTGCAEHSDIALTALAPYSHVGQTTSTHPTFAWYAPGGQPAVEFRLYAYGADGYLQPQPLYEVMLENSPGIATFTLSADHPGLTVGQRYYWQVALLCDPAHPSEDLVAGTEIEVVPTASDVASLWYDVLSTALASDANLLDLLSNLAAVENAASTELANTANSTNGNQKRQLEERSEELSQQSSQLMQIIESEQ